MGGARLRGRRDHDDRKLQGDLREGRQGLLRVRDDTRSTRTATRSSAAPGPTSSGGCEMAERRLLSRATRSRSSGSPRTTCRTATRGPPATSTRSTSTRSSPRRSGCPSNILHGLYMMGLVARANDARLAGGDPRALKRLSVQFRGMGAPGAGDRRHRHGQGGRRATASSSTRSPPRATTRSSATPRPSSRSYGRRALLLLNALRGSTSRRSSARWRS